MIWGEKDWKFSLVNFHVLEVLILRHFYLVRESAVDRSRKFASVEGGSMELIVVREGVARGVEVEVLIGRTAERLNNAGSSNPSSSDSPLLLSKFHW